MRRCAPQLLLMLTCELYDALPGAHTPEGAVYATALLTPSARSAVILQSTTRAQFECFDTTTACEMIEDR